MSEAQSMPDAQEQESDELTSPGTPHAVWCLNLSLGAGDGSDQMLAALRAPRYQLRRRGIAFAASPRHADIVFISGVLTHHTLEPVQRILAQVPEPHALVAIGDGALKGGVFADSPQVIANASDRLGANVEIGGDPPTPLQILEAIEAAVRLLDGEEEEEDEETANEVTEDGADEAAGDEEEAEEVP